MKAVAYVLAAVFALLMLGAPSVAQEIAQAIVFEDFNMTGSHTHIFMDVPDLPKADGFWNDKISSIVVLSGTWTFLEDPADAETEPNISITLGPGVYPDVTKEGIDDNSISQIRLAP